ncbi:MAG: hypothetical protein IJ158_01885 [Treponema sp.]|nr:hypothetical protein [Treponema sp.]
MRSDYIGLIKQKISDSQPGTVFVYSDFANIANAATVRQNLNRLAKEKAIRKIKNGVFEKPAYSNLLKEMLPVNPDSVAKAIARNFHWTISPSGNYALNILGLSNQVPAVWSYISDGPYKEYKIGDIKIEYKHRTNREISGMSDVTILVVQGLKALGKEHVDGQVIKILSEKLKSEDKKIILKEATESSEWIYAIIKKVCEV